MHLQWIRRICLVWQHSLVLSYHYSNIDNMLFVNFPQSEYLGHAHCLHNVNAVVGLGFRPFYARFIMPVISPVLSHIAENATNFAFSETIVGTHPVSNVGLFRVS